MASEQPTPEEYHKALATNPASRFQKFSLKLANGGTLTGISYIPTKQTTSQTGNPLLIGIHGATCSAYTYDVSPQYTASTYSEMFGVPFVAFNRPHFLDSSGWLVDRSSEAPKNPSFKPTEGNTFFQEEARWWHEYLFPALWQKFAVPNGCDCIITTSHSMATPITVLAASTYSAQAPEERKYKWAGMIASGYSEVSTQHMLNVVGARAADPSRGPNETPLWQDDNIHIPPFKPEDKADLMLGPKGLSSDASLRELIWQGNTPFLSAEVQDMVGWWPQVKVQAKAGVRIPVLYGLAEYDWVWQGHKKNVDAFCKDFVNAPRVEGACVEGSGHAIELGPCGRGWWIRCFGWALEVAVGMAVRELEGKPENFEQGEWPSPEEHNG